MALLFHTTSHVLQEALPSHNIHKKLSLTFYNALNGTMKRHNGTHGIPMHVSEIKGKLKLTWLFFL